MSPRINGYTIYVGASRLRSGGDWIVRVYRDSDDEHVHSAEGGVDLGVGLREAERAIARDVEVLAGGGEAVAPEQESVGGVTWSA